MNAAVESLRPRASLELIDDAAALLKRRWNVLAVVAAVALTPMMTLSIWMASRRTVDGSSLFDPQVLLELGNGGDSTASTWISLIAGSWTLAAISYAATQLTLDELVGQERSARELVVATARSARRWSGAWLLRSLAIAVGLLACGVGAVWAAVAFWVVVPIVAAEQLGPLDAMKRCKHLTAGARGRVFGIVVLVELITAGAQIAMMLLPSQIASGFVDGRALSIATAAIAAATAVVIESISAATMVNTYIDLRVRREGLDLDLQLRALTAGDAS